MDSKTLLAFADSYNSSFGYNISIYDIAVTIYKYSNGIAYTDYEYGTPIIDAWCLWSSAVAFAKQDLASVQNSS